MVDASVPGPSTGAPDATPDSAAEGQPWELGRGERTAARQRLPGDVTVGRACAAGGVVALLQ